MANIDTAGGDRLSSADYWLFDTEGTLYAISSDAQENSVLPDGTGLPGDPLGSPVITQMTDCLTASAQQRNLG